MKMKVRKSVARRFKITKSGKVLRRSAFGRHLRRSKSAAQKRSYRSVKTVSKPIAKRVKYLVGKA